MEKTTMSVQELSAHMGISLSDSIVEDEHGKLHKYYRLHAKQDHNMEMAFAYDIHCPDCKSGILKQISRPLSYNELGLYRCPVCDKK